ncbi:MAG: glycosyltransferase family A protein [Arcobacter sp.]|jgi:glycosyltransferase involved in cell wall biosynthesis|uniref:glycosyltransferase family 2 protein n=1 Tax=Arcobacter sp. TaxID=1872629 RepID=UPI002A75BB0E|nr:glycosyltransferase family A protein [Arcobacter sp.]MDY3204521.1 glycosyltransferase family A protein [Arcobacter sp.]
MISVIIPCYNSSKTILRALESVINQTYQDLEIIVVDDGSIDNIKKLIESFFIDKEVQYKYIYQKNSGPSTARNNGVINSNGEYIAFLDSDDEWHLQKLEIQMKVIIEKNLNFLGSTYTYDNLENENVDVIEARQYSFKKLLFSNKFSTPGVIMKKSFFHELGGFDVSMKYAEDYDLWIRASFKEDLNLIINPKLFRLYKSAYGDSGLSSHMFSMYKSELYLFEKIKAKKNINILEYFFFNMLVTIKFVRRLFINLKNKG